MRIGIIGAGAIGSTLAHALDDMEGIELIGIADRLKDKAAYLAEHVRKGRAMRLDRLGDLTDLVVESASQEAVREHLPKVLAKGKSVIVMSVGALADERLRKRLEGLARKHHCKVYIPTGAIGGIDAVRAARESTLQEVTLVTTKPPAALSPATKRRKVLFRGKANEAVLEYPQNINVAATLSLAGLGFQETKVEIIVDPLATRNVHKILAQGDFGRIRVEVENLPSPENPRTSYLAALSAVALIRRILSPIEVGS